MEYKFELINFSDPDQVKQLRYQQVTGHPDTYIPNWKGKLNSGCVDDPDIGYREYIQTHVVKVPPNLEDDCNGSTFGVEYDYINLGPTENLTSIFDLWWGDQCEFGKRVICKGDYKFYTSTSNSVINGVCFVINPKTITVSDIPENEYEKFPRDLGTT